MNKSIVFTAVIMLTVGLSAGYWLSNSAMTVTTSAGETKQPLFYRSSMDPTITSPIPAKGPMGMDYIPVYADEEQKASSGEILFYRNPMNPSVTSPAPAKGSMGMDYVPVYANGNTEDAVGTVEISISTVPTASSVLPLA